jgi:hypothetical protein
LRSERSRVCSAVGLAAAVANSADGFRMEPSRGLTADGLKPGVASLSLGCCQLVADYRCRRSYSAAMQSPERPSRAPPFRWRGLGRRPWSMGGVMSTNCLVLA